MNPLQADCVRFVCEAGGASPDMLLQAGYNARTWEACVRAGTLRWTRDGRLERALSVRVYTS
jgi:hypothetical protein